MSEHVPGEHPRHQPTNDGPGPHEGAEVDIPPPRSPLDDLPAIAAPSRDDSLFWNGLVEPDFQYDQTWKRGKRRRYRGYVERAAGAESGPLRESLAAAIRDLLDWASQQTDEQSTHDTPSADGDEESKKDSGKDGESR